MHHPSESRCREQVQRPRLCPLFFTRCARFFVHLGYLGQTRPLSRGMDFPSVLEFETGEFLQSTGCVSRGYFCRGPTQHAYRPVVFFDTAEQQMSGRDHAGGLHTVRSTRWMASYQETGNGFAPTPREIAIDRWARPVLYNFGSPVFAYFANIRHFAKKETSTDDHTKRKRKKRIAHQIQKSSKLKKQDKNGRKTQHTHSPTRPGQTGKAGTRHKQNHHHRTG